MYDDDRDKYDSPSMGGDDIEFEDEGPLAQAQEIGGQIAEKAVPFLKKFWPLILIAIIVLVAGFFLYSFFIGDMRNVEVSVVDTEGERIPTGIVEITDSGGNSVGGIRNGHGTISMRRGNTYNADAGAPTYKTAVGESFTVSGDNKWKITLEKNLDLELELRGAAPTSFATGETKTIPVTIINNTSREQNIKLVVSGDLDKVTSLIELVRENNEKVTVVPVGRLDATINLTINSKAKANDDVDGTIRIRGLDNSKARISIKNAAIIEFDSGDFDTSTTRINFRTVDAGTKNVEKEFRIENDSRDFTITDISFSLNISNDMTNHTKEEIRSWFSFSPESIEQLAPRTKRSVKILLNIPVNVTIAENQDTEIVDGEIVIDSGIGTRTLDINLKVRPVTVNLDLTGLDSSYKINKKDGSYPTKLDTITVNNKSEVSVELISLTPECEGTSHQWIKLSSDEFDLGPGDTKTIKMTIDVPPTEEEDIKFCKLIMQYFDPVRTGNRPSEQTDFTIEIGE